MDQLIQQMAILFPEFDRWFSAGFIVFARLLGFIRFAPIFNRKEIAGLVKLALVFILTIMLTPLLKPAAPPAGISPLLLLLLNFAVGAIIGYIAQLLILAIEAGGDMINTQMGLSLSLIHISVNVGDVVCIIEAMKLMNEIKSEQAGKVVQICVKNGDPIEFGQVLMYVE